MRPFNVTLAETISIFLRLDWTKSWEVHHGIRQHVASQVQAVSLGGGQPNRGFEELKAMVNAYTSFGDVST